jgi:hypothetical protein
MKAVILPPLKMTNIMLHRLHPMYPAETSASADKRGYTSLVVIYFDATDIAARQPTSDGMAPFMNKHCYQPDGF